MTEPYKVLLLVDPSVGATPAFMRAAQYAQALGARVQLALFDYRPALAALARASPEIGALALRAYRAEREQALQSLAARSELLGLQVHAELHWHARSEHAIVELVQSLRPDLVVKDVQHEPLLKRLLLQPLDWELLRRCPAPLLLVNSGAVALPARFFAAVDTGADGLPRLNDRLWESAARLAQAFGARAELVHVFDALPLVPACVPEADIAGLGAEYETLRILEQQRFESFARDHGVPPPRCHFLAGAPAQTLAALASDPRGDVLVLGCAHHGLLERALSGTTAEAVVTLAQCDVLAVKPD